MATSLTTDEQIKDLRVQLDRARDAQRVAEQDANDAKLEAEKLSASLVEATREANAADDTASAAMLQAKEASSKLEDAQTRAAAAEEAQKKAVAELAGVKVDLAACKEDCASLKSEVKHLDVVVARQQAQLDEAKPKLDAYAAMLAAAGA
jgi:chromosome segregation ATPase